MPRALLSVTLAAILAGCAAATVNYADPAGPRYAAPAPAPSAAPETLSVVAFNLQYGRHVAEVAGLLRGDGPLHDPDILLVQEMDEAGTRALADSLGFGYVYYPATVHPATRRGFGNAVLSRFPIEEDRKIVLPHLARFRRTLRAAVGATLVVGTHRVRVYSVHIATLIGNGPRARREQLAAILADAEPYRTVVVGGDFNSETVPAIALARGYAWPTRGLPHTGYLWTFDHLLLRGLTLASPAAVGVARENHRVSDHKAVWARVVLPADRSAPTR